MEDKSPQGMKVPLIVAGVAVVVIAVGIMVRSGNSPAPESVATPDHPAPPVAEGQQFTLSSLTAKDDNGDNWMLGLASGPPQGFVSGEKPGAPVSVKADVQGGGQQVSIGLIIAGNAGEIYQPTVVKNGAILPAPKFTVLDESGATIGSGSFEYG
jgi:hypothetical protein